jgi:hypothetical protein
MNYARKVNLWVAISEVFWWWFLSRVMIFVLAYLSLAVLSPVHNQPVPLFSGRLAAATWTRITTFDTGWYESIALRGYDRPDDQTQMYQQQRNWAFFPLYPALLWLFRNRHVVTGLCYLALLGAGFLLYCLVSPKYGEDMARVSVIMFFFWPWSYSLSAARPEGFLALLWLLCYTAFERGRPLVAASSAFFAALAKPNGFLISVALVANAVQSKRCADKRTILAICAGPLALAGFSVYMWLHTGDPLSWSKIQSTWGAAFIKRPLIQLRELFTTPMLVNRWGWDASAFNWLAFALSLIMVWHLWKLELPLAVFLLVVSLFSFLNFGEWVHGRHLAATFPLFIGLALTLKRHKRLSTSTILLFSALLALFVIGMVLGVHAFLA